VKDVPAAVVAIAIVIAGVAVVDAVRAAVLEEVTVAIPAVVAADGEEGKIEHRVDSSTRGPQRWGPFSMSLALWPRAETLVWRGHVCTRALEG
jgi:hypothetical protein